MAERSLYLGLAAEAYRKSGVYGRVPAESRSDLLGLQADRALLYEAATRGRWRAIAYPWRQCSNKYKISNFKKQTPLNT